MEKDPCVVNCLEASNKMLTAIKRQSVFFVQGGALERSRQRRLPEDRRRDAEEHVFSEGDDWHAGSPFARHHRRHGTSRLHGCHVCPQEFTGFLQKHDEVLTELEKATKRLKKLETVYKEFELQKVCYLPLNTFLLKPIQRLMHYKLILERLCKHYTPAHRDLDDCKGQCAASGEGGGSKRLGDA